jgi:ornithine carbamoyltransferase
VQKTESTPRETPSDRVFRLSFYYNKSFKMNKKDFISITDVSPREIDDLLKLAARLKKSEDDPQVLTGKTIALIFEKPSTRTLVSFAGGIHGLGGFPLVLQSSDLQWKRGESVPDMARVMSRYIHGIVIRARSHADVESFARHSSIPIINGLTDTEHPCQVLADLLTIWERQGRKMANLRKLRIVFLGDSNNVSYSWMLLAGMLGLNFVLACPEGYNPDPAIWGKARGLAAASGGKLELMHDPVAAAREADVLYTDVWTSMGHEAEEARRKQDFQPFQLNAALVAKARPGVIVLHCLPARRGEEITDEVIEGPNSLVFDQAENRLHIEQAILVNLLKRAGKKRR